MAKRILSFDLRANFACFKKPDVNDGIILTFNCLHKPALLGILGAIIGLKGYNKKGEFPEYYQAFKDLPVGIEPLEGFHEKGNFSKAIIKYTNTVGYANSDGTLIITEQTLINPAYRCYVMLDDTIEYQAKLKQNLLNGESVYLPYLGKNEFSAWWNMKSVLEYDYSLFSAKSDFKINSIFVREYPLHDRKIRPKYSPSLGTMINQSSYMYFERLPIGFDEKLYQYELGEFAFTDWTLKQDAVFEDLYTIKSLDKIKVIQLF
ncbi:CRISPR-associated protein Cas5h [Pseudarcicella hirudinis]|uniref:CRISPR-associated protein Cas5h n=1 Tax=Pseudarcicella hirudinis TaxID=1079859 RepID=A0A1I5VKJ4_9BACT|nr:type I-B CRISPR-associated protein Cas5b [Pseudarcicella hirudinis]SFQ08025.1 CRISPR-associated protein Cas5h [Pseudarcicella hirudinis]